MNLAVLLTVLFVGLKLTSYIDWTWWWVLSPLWISFAISFVWCFVLAVIGLSMDLNNPYRILKRAA